MKWNDYFNIECVENPLARDMANPTWMSEDYYKYELRDNQGNLIGTYRDMRYAKKQAEYKFKKIMAKLEKILLT